MRFLPCLVLATLVACGGPRHLARQELRDKARLSETALAFWDALRWDQVQDASAAYEDLDARARFVNARMAGGGFRIVDCTVMGVEVSTPLPTTGDPGPHIREGRVLVRLDGYNADTQVALSTTLAQRWYRTKSGWFLEAADVEKTLAP